MQFCKRCQKEVEYGNMCLDCLGRKEQSQITKPKNYLVFQGKTFFTELNYGIVWAPIQNANGQRFFYWDILQYLKIGDKIFHCHNSKIEAISTVVKEATKEYFPEKNFDEGIYDDLYNEDNYKKKGWCVHCNYVRYYKKPLYLKLYREKIKQLSQYKYSPFNRNGTANQGYLFSLCNELAVLFQTEITKFN